MPIRYSILLHFTIAPTCRVLLSRLDFGIDILQRLVSYRDELGPQLSAMVRRDLGLL